MNFTDTDLVLYADGLLSPARKQQMQVIAETNSSLANTLKALEASRLPFKSAFDHQTLPPVPDSLRSNVHDWSNVVREAYRPGEIKYSSPQHRSRHWLFRGLHKAVCLVACICVGYTVGVTSHQPLMSGSPVTAQQRSGHLTWVERVVNYQSLYVANTTLDIEVDWPAAMRAIDELAVSTGMATHIPDLTQAGYEFARIQELGFEGQPLVQLIYNRKGHLPLALCFMPAGGESEAVLRFAPYAHLTAADWIVNDQRFVLVGDESEVVLRSIYSSIRAEFPET